MCFPGHKPKGKYKVIKIGHITNKQKNGNNLIMIIFWCLSPHLPNCGNSNFIQIPHFELEKAKNFSITIHTSFFTHQAMGSGPVCGWWDAPSIPKALGCLKRGCGCLRNLCSIVLVRLTPAPGVDVKVVWWHMTVMTSVSHASCVPTPFAMSLCYSLHQE